MASCGMPSWASLASNPGLSHLATEIFLRLDLESLAKLELVCKAWRGHIIDNRLWKCKLKTVEVDNPYMVLIEEAIMDIMDKVELHKKCRSICRHMAARIKTNVNSGITTTHLAGNGLLVCGHLEGTVSLIDLNRMRAIKWVKAAADSRYIISVISNENYILCVPFSAHAHVFLFTRSLELVAERYRPERRCSTCCSMNRTHFAVGTLSAVHVYTATDSPQLVSSIAIRLYFFSHIHLLQPGSNRFWAASFDNIILYEEGVEKKRLPIGEMVCCVCPSSDGRTIWTGTVNGNLFSCDVTTGQVTKTPVQLEGVKIIQIEEAKGGKSLVILSGEGKFQITVASTADWTERRVFRNKQYISHFSVKDDDAVVFGDSSGVVRFAPL